jgi:hypothetical protein
LNAGDDDDCYSDFCGGFCGGGKLVMVVMELVRVEEVVEKVSCGGFCGC